MDKLKLYPVMFQMLKVRELIDRGKRHVTETVSIEAVYLFFGGSIANTPDGLQQENCENRRIVLSGRRKHILVAS